MLRRLNFSFWYFFHPPWDSGISPPELFDFISKHPPGRAIDIGCGSGTNVVTLARHGWQVAGVDFAPTAIAMARRKVRAAGLHADLRVRDVTDLKGVQGPFDLALDLGCFHGVSAHSAYLAELDRVLSPGGYWLMYGFFKEDRHAEGPGLTQVDIREIESSGFLSLERKDGFDRHDRRSAWFLFQRSPSSLNIDH